MFTRYGKFRRPQHCRCLEACGGFYHMGFSGAYNTVEENVGAYNTVCVRAVVEYCSYRRTGDGPWYRGLTCVPYLSFFVCSLIFSKRASLVYWSQSALVALVREGQ